MKERALSVEERKSLVLKIAGKFEMSENEIGLLSDKDLTAIASAMGNPGDPNEVSGEDMAEMFEWAKSPR